MRVAERSVSHPDEKTPSILTVCDEELLCHVNSVLESNATLDTADVNETYLHILRRYNVAKYNLESGNYRKRCKALISSRMSNVHFVKSARLNEPEKIVKSIPLHLSWKVTLRS